MNTMHSTVAILTLVTALAVNAEASPKLDRLFDAPRLEWVPAAVSLVRKVEPEEREQLMRDVLAGMAERQPLLMPSLVGALSKALPDHASAIALEAATLVPDFAADIARAAVASAPEQADDIAACVARVFAEHESKRGVQTTRPTTASALRAESARIIVAAVIGESPASAAVVETAVGRTVVEYRSHAALNGRSGRQPGEGNGKGQGDEIGHGTVKPHPGNGDPAHKGEGSQGRGRGTIHGRGTLNNYDSAR